MSRETELDRRFRTAAHPDAPAGGGGPGYFNTQRPPSGCGATRTPRFEVTDADLERLFTAATRGLPLVPEELRNRIADLFTPESFGIIAVCGSVWFASQTTPAGWIADVVIAGVGVVTVGADAVKLGRDVAAFAQIARTACSDADLDVAAKHFASAISTLIVNAPILFGEAVKGTAAVRFAAKVTKWRAIIRGLEFNVEIDRGALWTGMNWRSARILAQSRKTPLVTLEAKLDELGLMKLYDNDFGSDWNPTIRDLWFRMSKKYASALHGRVRIYVEGSLSGDPNKLVLDELEEITDVLERNPKVTFIEVRNIANDQLPVALPFRATKIQNMATQTDIVNAVRSNH